MYKWLIVSLISEGHNHAPFWTNWIWDTKKHMNMSSWQLEVWIWHLKKKKKNSKISEGERRERKRNRETQAQAWTTAFIGWTWRRWCQQGRMRRSRKRLQENVRSEESARQTSGQDAVISLPRPWVQLLLGELKPHKLHGAANVMSKREENVSRYSYCWMCFLKDRR